MAAFAVTLAVSAHPIPAQTVIFSDAFTTGATGWAMLNQNNGLWHYAPTGSCGALTPLVAYNAGTTSCNYSTGAGISNSGDLVSPFIPLIGTPPYTLTYLSKRMLDSAGGDSTVVAVRPAGSTVWTNVGTPAGNVGATQLETHTIPPGFQGQSIQLGFRFSANGTDNSTLGWMVDSVSLTSAGAPPPPTVATIAPNHGPTTGLGGVTISGTNFLGTTSVVFGSVPATTFTVVSQTSLVVTAPPQSAGWVNVTVNSVGGTGALAQAFDYFVSPTTFGASCNGANLVAFGSPTLGSSLTIQIQSGANSGHALCVGFSNTAYGATPLPWSLTPFGFVGCFLRVSPDLLLDLGPNASVQFTVPNLPSLVGLHQYVQGVALTAITSFTPGLDVLIGP